MMKILRANLKSQEKEEEFGEDRLGRLRTCLWDLLEYPETSKVFYNGVGCLTFLPLLSIGLFSPFLLLEYPETCNVMMLLSCMEGEI